jgi:hypothetical protein
MARVRAAVPSSVDRTVRSSPGTPARFRSGDAHLFPEELYRSVHQARTIGGGISVDYTLGWRTPIIGPVWMMVRRRIHQEIRIYIDALTTRQSNLNTHLVRAISVLVETLDALGLPALKRRQQEHAETLAALQEEVRALRSHVLDLQARLDALSSSSTLGTSARS